MKKIMGRVLLLSLGLGSCGMPALFSAAKAPVGETPQGRKFSTHGEVLAYVREEGMKEISSLEPGHYYGDSLMINLPPDSVILTPLYTGMDVSSLNAMSSEQRDYLMAHCKLVAELVAAGFARAGLFDSVTIKQSSSYLHQASGLGYRFVLNFNKATELTLVDLTTGEERAMFQADQTKQILLAELVHKVERTLEKLAMTPRQAAAKGPDGTTQSPPVEGMHYDEATRRGWVSFKGRGLEARGLVLRRIAEICATKNKLLISDELASRGAFKVYDEELKDGVLKISFEALY
jgi:hypothetical protein